MKLDSDLTCCICCICCNCACCNCCCCWKRSKSFIFWIPGGNDVGCPGKYEVDPDRGETCSARIFTLKSKLTRIDLLDVEGVNDERVVEGAETFGGVVQVGDDEAFRLGWTRFWAKREFWARFSRCNAAIVFKAGDEFNAENIDWLFCSAEFCNLNKAACCAASSSIRVRFVASADTDAAPFPSAGRVKPEVAVGSGGDELFSETSLRIISGLSVEFSSPEFSSELSKIRQSARRHVESISTYGVVPDFQLFELP